VNRRAVCRGEFTLPLPVAEAVPLFTPEGERRWAGPSWDPLYPVADARQDDSAPGTVFTTESHGGAATWIVLERRGDGMRYARVAPGQIAGTIDVRCAEAAPEQTLVTVEYDVTSLGPDGTAFVGELESGFDAFLEGWRHEILASLTT
jgi:hypothetical protein